nr:immunoglobulin heavy chain junction region [Mus musculus]MBK4183762.1 immunoglobulin heavy chain junction region [Mus musculus]MBK4187666.1 immunoglobulin heavy chain junction region [Mus musculus]
CAREGTTVVARAWFAYW